MRNLAGHSTRGKELSGIYIGQEAALPNIGDISPMVTYQKMEITLANNLSLFPCGEANTGQ